MLSELFKRRPAGRFHQQPESSAGQSGQRRRGCVSLGLLPRHWQHRRPTAGGATRENVQRGGGGVGQVTRLLLPRDGACSGPAACPLHNGSLRVYLWGAQPPVELSLRLCRQLSKSRASHPGPFSHKTFSNFSLGSHAAYKYRKLGSSARGRGPLGNSAGSLSASS